MKKKSIKPKRRKGTGVRAWGIKHPKSGLYGLASSSRTIAEILAENEGAIPVQVEIKEVKR